MAERLGISRTTLGRLEAGESSIAIGTYLRALKVLGLESSIDTIAYDDPIGRALQDEEVSIRRVRKLGGEP